MEDEFKKWICNADLKLNISDQIKKGCNSSLVINNMSLKNAFRMIEI